MSKHPRRTAGARLRLSIFFFNPCMTISALVLSLDPSFTDTVTRRLSRIPELHLGPLHGTRLAVVVDAGDAEKGMEVTRMLLDTEGVERVDVVSIDFDPGEEA